MVWLDLFVCSTNNRLLYSILSVPKPIIKLDSSLNDAFFSTYTLSLWLRPKFSIIKPGLPYKHFGTKTFFYLGKWPKYNIDICIGLCAICSHFPSSANFIWYFWQMEKNGFMITSYRLSHNKHINIFSLRSLKAYSQISCKGH